MFEVPAAIPVTIPVDESTVAIAVLLLLQDPIPPPRTTEFVLNVVVPEIQIVFVPVTDAILAFGITVTPKVLAELVPQLLAAVTLIFPFWPELPVVTFIEFVP